MAVERGELLVGVGVATDDARGPGTWKVKKTPIGWRTRRAKTR